MQNFVISNPQSLDPLRLSVGSLYQISLNSKFWKMMDLSVGLFRASLQRAAGAPGPLSRRIF